MVRVSDTRPRLQEKAATTTTGAIPNSDGSPKDVLSVPGGYEHNISHPHGAQTSIPLPAFPYRHSSNREIPTVRTHPTSHQTPAVPPPPSGASLAFTALQFLPTPLLVLSKDKTVVLANEAMGRLLGMEPPNDAINRLAGVLMEPSSPSITELLFGKSLSDLGVNILQRNSPLWISWELFLEALAKDMSGDTDGFANANSLINMAGGISPASDVPPLLRGHPVRDVALDIYFSNILPKENSKPDNYPRPPQIQAKMIVSIWILDSQQYFTLTFTSMASPLPPTGVDGSFFPKMSAPCVDPQPARLGSALLPMGAPASSDISTAPSSLERMIRMKDAVLDAMEVPVFGSWHDGSMGFTNRAAQELSGSSIDTYTFHENNLTKQFKVYTEDFERELSLEEYPMMKLLRTKRTLELHRLGMYSSTGKKMVFDTHGDGVYDNETGEFLGGLIWLRDVTEFQEKLVTQEETNELRFMTMCDCMPQLVCLYARTRSPCGTVKMHRLIIFYVDMDYKTRRVS